ncbi:MAG: hypothetical protein HON93_05875 [Flavobacteriaceae bacterium]|nr:hypothetical protein [Flavobacteriaceae bacterium]
MKAFVSTVIFGLMVGCGSLKSNTQTLTQTPGIAKKQTVVKPLPPNTASNKYSKKRLVKNNLQQ